MHWTPTSGEQERHNVTVITVGSKYEVYVRSPASSHMQTLKQPFLEACSKVRGKYIWKEVFLRLPWCVVYHCVSIYPVYICVFLHESADDSATFQVTLFKETNNDSLIKRPIFLVIQLFQNFYIFLHFLYIHHYLYITNITPYSPDDGSAKLKHYSVDFVPQ